MKKILLLSLMVCLSASASVILYTDVPDSFKKLVKEAESEVQYRVNNHSGDYIFELSTYEPHISLAYLFKEKISLNQVYGREPSLKTKLIALANRTAPIVMDESIQNLQIELWPCPNARTYLGKTYKNGIILVIHIPAPCELLSFTQEIDTALDALPSVDKRRFAFKAHATIGWLYQADDQKPLAFAQQLKELLEKYIARFNARNEQYMIDSFVLASGNQKKRFTLKTSNAFQSGHSRPSAHPVLPEYSHCPTMRIQSQSACPRSR